MVLSTSMNVLAYLLTATVLLLFRVLLAISQEQNRTTFWTPVGENSVVVVQTHGDTAFLACRLKNDEHLLVSLTMEDLSEVTPLKREHFGRLEMKDATDSEGSDKVSSQSRWREDS